MSDPAGDRDDDAASDWPAEPEEGPLPGEDNPGERLIEKYDPTTEGSGEGANEKTAEEMFEDADVDGEVARLFWILVGVFNVALLALSLGAMLIVFQDRWTLGGQLLLAGTILLVYGYYRYRNYRADDED